jgi:hypothetical protein
VHFADGPQTENVDADLVSGTYFGVLGLAPAAGRLIGPEDDRTPGAHPVVVLGHRFFQSALSAATQEWWATASASTGIP